MSGRLALYSLFQQRQKKDKGESVKISINQENVPEEVIRREMQNIQKQTPAMDEAKAFDHASKCIIEWTLIRQKAEKQVTIEQKDIEPPDDAMIEAYYRTHSEAFVQPEQVHAAHIVKHPQGENAEIAAASELTAVRKRLLDGEAFLKVAEECSECNDTPPDLGTFPRGKMVPEFELVVFSMNPGGISPVFKTPLASTLPRYSKERPPLP